MPCVWRGVKIFDVGCAFQGGQRMSINQLIFCKCKRKCKFSVHCIAVLSLRENHYGSGVKDNCNVLVIGILYNGETEGIDCGFPCFLPEYDAVFHAQKIAKKDCPFLLFYPILGV
jgi:hypothetical protein